MNGKKLLVAELLALMCFVGLQGCASTSARVPTSAPPQIALSASESAAVATDMLTIEDLLRWPLEGPGGVDRTITSLRQVFAMEERVGKGLHGHGPVTLKDGYVLESATVYPNDQTIHMHPGQAPCFSPERAVEITGAMRDPLFRSDHGVDIGHTYNVTRNGVWLRFTSTPETYRCVIAIHVRLTREAYP